MQVPAKLNSMAEAIDFLYSSLPVFHRQGPAAYKADIGNIAQLMEFAGNPHLSDTKYIHIAGTNGKGSVAHLTAAYITASGYTCGLYTSPHYENIRERIKIDGELVGEKDFVRILNEYLPVIASIKPSFFEIICAMALTWFHSQKVDYAVIEVGMGGRLDSTNIITPVLSVITNISFDHTAFLGNTLEAIAGEKAGIIKSQIPVLIGEYQNETAPVFIKRAKEEGSPIIFAKDVATCITADKDNYNGIYEVSIDDLLKKTILTSTLSGKYQVKNIRTAAGIVWCLNEYALLSFEKQTYLTSIENCNVLTNFIGRWQLVRQQPDLILDGAHNIAGVKECVEQLQLSNYSQIHILFGTVSDKDVLPVLALLPTTARYYWTKADIPRAMDPGELAEKSQESGIRGEVFPSVESALDAALENAMITDLILVMGSIFVAGEAMNILRSAPDK